MNITPEIEQRLWASAGVSRISDIPGFPFADHQALKAAVGAGKAQLGIEYAAARDLIRITQSPTAAVLTYTLTLVMPALMLLSVIVAVTTRNWWALGGIVSSFLGQMFTNPYNPLKRLGKLLVAGAVLHVTATESITEGFTWISFAFAISAIALWLLNRLAWRWAHNAVLASEAFAAHLFKANNLHIRDDRGEMHDAVRS